MTSWLTSGLPRQFIVIVAEEPVLDLVPLAGAGRQVADRDGQAGLGGQGGEFGLPQAQPGAVRPATVGGDQQFAAGVGALARMVTTTSGGSSPRRTPPCRGRCPR